MYVIDVEYVESMYTLGTDWTLASKEFQEYRDCILHMINMEIVLSLDPGISAEYFSVLIRTSLATSQKNRLWFRQPPPGER